MKEVDWKDKLLKDAYPECSPVGPSIEELFQAFKLRLQEEGYIFNDSEDEECS